MSDSRKQLGGFAIFALVMLRLAIGWHFFSEGLEKIERDSFTGKYRVNFSAAGFLNQAKGPFVGFFRSLAPSGHDWQTELAVPRQNRPLTFEEAKAPATEQAPYQNWYGRIATDWQAIVDNVIAVPGLTAGQIEAAKASLKTHQQELKNYLESESAAIARYQHELWRLGEWRAKPEAASVPFQEERIAKKAADTSASAKTWVGSVEELEQSFLADLREILAPEQRTDATAVSAMNHAVTSPAQSRLDGVNLGTTVLTIGVGICLLLGLFTRLASLAGALFLLSIIATQPPWLATAEPTIYQTVELTGLLILAGTSAGRWLGLDYFSWALFRKHED